MEDRRVRRVRDHDRVGELDAEPAVRVEAEARLAHGRLRELRVHRGDPGVRAVVVSAVRADRPVHPVDEAHVVADEAPEPRQVEVERVEEARVRPTRDPVLLDRETPAPELALERAEELVAAARRRWRVGVEDRDVGAPGAGRAEIALRPHARGDVAERRAGVDERGARLRSQCHRPRTVDRVH